MVPFHPASLPSQTTTQLRWRLADDPLIPEDSVPNVAERAQVRTKIFLGYTSNLVRPLWRPGGPQCEAAACFRRLASALLLPRLPTRRPPPLLQVSAGVREHIRFLVQHRLVDVLVTTAGGVEEDLIKVRQGAASAKSMTAQLTLAALQPTPAGMAHVPTPFLRQCLAPTFVGDFQLKGADLRRRGLNRIGNMLVRGWLSGCAVGWRALLSGLLLPGAIAMVVPFSFSVGAQLQLLQV